MNYARAIVVLDWLTGGVVSIAVTLLVLRLLRAL